MDKEVESIIELLKNNHNLISFCILLGIFSFIIGTITIYILFLCWGKGRLKEKIGVFIEVTERFLKHFVNLIPVIFILIIIYLVVSIFNYENELLPNLASVAISIYFIDFIINENELKKKSKLRHVLGERIDKIIGLSEKMLFDYMGLETYKNKSLDKELINDILLKKDLETECINNFTYINQQGECRVENILLVDYLFYIGQTIRPIIAQIMVYSIYLDYEQFSVLVQIEELLNKNIFKSKPSPKLKVLKEQEIPQYEQTILSYKQKIVDNLYKLDRLITVLKNTGGNIKCR